MHARANADSDPPQRRRRDVRDLERPSAPRRAARRRRQSTPWLQRNALSVAAASVLVALLGLGFGLLQMINHPEPSPSLLTLGQGDASAASSTAVATSTSESGVQLASIGGGAGLLAGPASNDVPRQIRAGATVIQPNYTVAAGDTLGQIATRFNTSVDRIQAFNNLADPRVLRIGSKLVIPPPLQ
jgi:LysM repeat protein